MKWDLEDIIPTWFQWDRKSKDPVINDNAPQMVDLCTSYNLYVLNGSFGSDIAGDFTFFSPYGGECDRL